MSRFIDAIRLRTEVDLLLARKKISPNTMLMMKNLIDKQPTAYDVEKVVENVKKFAESKEAVYYKDGRKEFAWEKVIEIVQEGLCLEKFYSKQRD